MQWDNSDESEENEDNKKIELLNEDSDEEISKSKKVQTPKEKLSTLIKEKYQKIKSAISDNNFILIEENLDELYKNTDKILHIFTEDDIPILFLESLCLIEERLKLSKEEQKKLKKDNNISFNNIKKTINKNKGKNQKLEKLLSEHKNNRPKEDALREAEEAKEEKADESKSESHEEDKADDKIRIKTILERMKQEENLEPAKRRLKWVKKERIAHIEKTEKPKKIDEKPTRTEQKEKPKQNQNERESEIEGKVTPEEVELTDKEIEKELSEISEQRGQSRTPFDTLARLDFLLDKTVNLKLKIEIASLFILICFDASPGQFTFLEIELWDKICNKIILLFDFYEKFMKESTIEKEKEKISKDLENNLISILEKLEMELYKSLQFTDYNSIDYLTRIKNEGRFLILCRKIEQFYRNLNNFNSVARVYLLVIMHIYYKNEMLILLTIQKFSFQLEKDDYFTRIKENPSELMKSLCDCVYQNLDEKSKLRATLCNIYFLCVNNKYNEAKNLFSLSNSYELILIFKEESLKTLYNRTLSQLGLSAFRLGKFNESLLFLSSLCSFGTTKLKEFLSQSYNKESEKNILFDKEIKKRAIPHIMAIDIDEIESIFYLSSMIVDTPSILLSKIGSARHIKRFGGFFSKVLSNFDKQIFNGPSETNKERILNASSLIIKGDWKRCLNEINQVTLVKKSTIEIRTLLEKNIKSTALRNYLIFYMKEFDSYDLNVLEKRFDLDKKKIKNIVNDMILDEEINAKWKKNILIVRSDDRENAKMLKKLVDNVTIITKQNVDLLTIAAGVKRAKEN